MSVFCDISIISKSYHIERRACFQIFPRLDVTNCTEQEVYMFLAMQQEKRPKQFQTARQLDVVPKIFILNSTIQCILHSAKKIHGVKS